MKKVLKWLAIILGIVLGILALFLAITYISFEQRINKNYSLQVEPVAIPTDAASVEYGNHVATIRACIDCHDPDFSGKNMIDDPAFGSIDSANLTSGKGGIGGTFTDADFVRAIRHGVGADGKPLIVMPSSEFYWLSDADLGALISYIKSVPPVDKEHSTAKVAIMLRTINFLTGQPPMFPAEKIDHNSPRPIAPEPGVTAEYGKYLAVTCTGCHGEGLSGGYIPGIPQFGPEPLNLTPGGELVGWSEADFIQTLSSGVTPSGHQLDNEYMPWKIFGQMTDVEQKAVWAYLQTIPAKTQGNR